jgi:hypothetical protein
MGKRKKLYFKSYDVITGLKGTEQCKNVLFCTSYKEKIPKKKQIQIQKEYYIVLIFFFC